jgi:hypothetical protein
MTMLTGEPVATARRALLRDAAAAALHSGVQNAEEELFAEDTVVVALPERYPTAI